MRCLLLVLAWSGALAAQNLVTNAGFEVGPRPGGLPSDWAGQTPPGGALERTGDRPHSGAWALRLVVPPEAPVTWYQATAELTPPRVAQPLVLSAWVRCQGVGNGAGAYLSVNAFDGAGRRLANFDSDQLTGTSDWRRLTVVARPPAGTTSLKVVLLLHGQGEAVFDDVQLEVGEQPTGWQPSPLDQQREQRVAAQRVEADAALRRFGWRRVVGRNAAILAEPLPTTGRPTAPADLRAALTAAGWEVADLTAADLANEALLDPARFDLLVLPWGDAFPAAAHPALTRYLAAGGCFLSLGGYAFDRPLVRAGDQWLQPDRLPPGQPTFTASVDEFATPRPATPAGQHALETAVRAVPGADGLAWRLATPSLDGWATVRLPVDVAKLPAGWSTTRLRAKADRDGTQLIVEWTERDQSRWQKVLQLGTAWQEYDLPAGDLSYWHDNPSIGRGGPTDRFQPAQAAAMMFGFSVAEERQGSALGVDLDWVRVVDDPYAAVRGAAPRVNTRHGTIRDALHPAPEQIGAFDPSHPLLDVAGLRAAANQTIAPAGFRADASLTGLAATCVLGVNGHGFDANRCRLVPVLDAVDREGGLRGAAVSLAYHYNGYYQGSAWGFCGVDNQDLFGRGRPCADLLAPLADALVRRIFLHDADAEYACYRPGETMVVRCQVSALGALPADGAVRLLAGGREVGRQPVKVAAGSTAACRWEVPVPGDQPFLDLRFELVLGDRVVDALDNGVVVWRDGDVRGGPAVAQRDAFLTFRGQPRFLVGSQMWWGQVNSVTARSPLQFRRDFEAMQRLGFHVARDFLRLNTEQERRLSDAVVALAARHEVVLFHTPNLSPYAAPAERLGQAAVARQIAERYRGLPHVLIDLCNEPRVSTEIPEPRPAWNAWLRRKYGTDAALRAAWGGQEPAEPLDQVPLPQPTDAWADRATSDLYHFLMDDHLAWSAELRGAIRAVDPSRLVSVGYLPGHGWNTAGLVMPHLGSLDLDFSNRHFYGPVQDFPAQHAWIDLRLLGKPSSLGEFGARNHPSFGNLSEDAPTYEHRHEYIVTHAFGMGGSFACSWHWRDPMEGIFPFGQLHADGVERPVAARMAAMARAFGALDRRQVLPALAVVLPEEHSLGGGRLRLAQGIARCFDTLLGLHVPFTVIADRSLPQLPASVTKLIAPLPYVLRDDSYAALLAFVRRGGRLVVTGDLGYTPDRVRAATDRLAELCGVTLSQPTPPLAVTGETLASPAGGGWPAFGAHPVGRVSARGATARGPLVFEQRVGAGQVLYVAAPLELEPAETCDLRVVYAAVVQWLGAQRLRVEPDEPSVHVFRVDLVDGGRRYVVWNEGPRRLVRVADPAGERRGEAPERSWTIL